jgi:molybdopterin-biosynthesis enzyme MoeA-like protein
MPELKFFALIIGTEILNRRRVDAHFDFVTQALQDKGYTLSGSFIIEDDPVLIVDTITFISSQTNSILFSFGGIGSTPDDHTRQCAARALKDGKLYRHSEAEKIIVDTLGERAYPHSVKMAQLPQDSKLLHNPVNNMPAFSVDDRFFFMPGFPEMSHPMLRVILDELIPQKKMTYRHTLTAKCKENIFIGIMEQMPESVEFSSLPKRYDDGGKLAWKVTLSVSSDDKVLSAQAFKMYTDLLDQERIPYTFEDESNA